MITFIASIIALVFGFVLYGRFIERKFGIDKSRKTPAYAKQDDVDYFPMPLWKVFLIQFLNIAGTGPIFGAISGILFGPAAYLWIVFGCIFGGAVHDYLSGMISMRKGGSSLPEIIGDELGATVRRIMRVFTILLLMMVGAVFVSTPAGLLEIITPTNNFLGSYHFWVLVIVLYYILATLLPINAIIGKIYPIFGFSLLVMAVGVFIGVFQHEGAMPEITEAFYTHHPKGLSIFPYMFITIACGAVSGFHATQSPLMARCIKTEKSARTAFYGAMIAEGLVAIIWAGAAIKFANGDSNNLAEQMGGNPAKIVNFICETWLGKVGAFLAILGVIAAPITTGDTALRSARLITAEMLHFRQNSVIKRIMITLPIFIIVSGLMAIDFSILWRYFGWYNQILSSFTLWAITVYMYRHKKNYYITLFPALFMTFICCLYILVSPEGLHISEKIGSALSATVCLIIAALVTMRIRKLEARNNRVENEPSNGDEDRLYFDDLQSNDNRKS